MKLPIVEKYDPVKHGSLGPCPWEITARQVKKEAKPCVIDFVVRDPFSAKPVGYCRTHFVSQLQTDEELRAALLAQLADKLL